MILSFACSLLVCMPDVPAAAAPADRSNLARGPSAAGQYGVYEIELTARGAVEAPYLGTKVRVVFTGPDGADVVVDAFYDGDGHYKARAYCHTTGQWTWRSESDRPELDGRKGAFTVEPSDLPGKLRLCERDPYQFAYDNGDWFLHIGDTGYRYAVDSEPRWREYIDEAAEMGVTKVRTWFCRSRSGVEALFAEGRKGMNLAYWQEIDRRLSYALDRHPNIIFQLILYGEDTKELLRYDQGDPACQYVARYAQARWSAFPNVYWCISNDREIVRDRPLQGRRVPHGTIDRIGRDMEQREPWGTLITNHQARLSGYDFTEAPWSDIVTLEDLDQVHGKVILAYRDKAKRPIVNDEDRYELYRNPANHRYFFRRLMWASLLSGGHATYGGLRTYEAYDGGPQRGVQGYFRANRAGVLSQGGHDFRHIHSFFGSGKMDLIGMRPDDACVGGDPLKWKCCHTDRTYIIYLANPTGADPRTDNPHFNRPSVTVTLPEGKYRVRWFDPRSGEWTAGGPISGGRKRLKTPGDARIGWGDWIVVLDKTS